jgi:predicted NAD/FAD-binding protein
MSFSVRSDRLEYNGRSLDALFSQRRNLISPSFHRMIRDILKFNRQASRLADSAPDDRPLRDFLAEHNYGAEFVDQYLVPMAAAIWSAEPGQVLDMPTAFLVRFFDHHGLLQLRDRPQWRVISGGSREYVRKLVDGHRDRIRLNAAVRSVHRHAAGVEVKSSGSEAEFFDAVFLACHSDQALALLTEPTVTEESVLGAIGYQPNEAILHSDERMLPGRRKAWAAWNYHLSAAASRQVAVTYNMNILQGLHARNQYCVTLNGDAEIRTDRIIKRIRYEHPMYTREAIAAQARHREVNRDRLFFCGAYWQNGFHEDGVVSALQAVKHFEEWQQDAELRLRRAS